MRFFFSHFLLTATLASLSAEASRLQPRGQAAAAASSYRISQRVVPFINNLHARARSAIRQKNYKVASELYKSILYRFPEHVQVPPTALEDTYLLMALQHQREQRIEDARSTFQEGLKRTSLSSKLLTSLALMESKQEGRKRLAQNIVKAVEKMDPERGVPLHRWKMFSERP
mmetsp:Transcript_17827/g.34529  ORF Transcript_17827/g.34529 Transcript_17827/m.34529 type:complete len:172 (+) Transcript_17827:94-609(+)